MICEKCGKPIAPSKKFCAKCGTPVPKDSQTSININAQVEPSPMAIGGLVDCKDGKQIVFKYVGAGMLAATFLIGYLFDWIRLLFASIHYDNRLIILAVSGLGNAVFGVIGIIKVLQGKKPFVCCIMTLVFSGLGVAGGFIVNFKCLDGILTSACAIVALILIHNIKENNEPPVDINVSNGPNRKDPFD